MIDIVRYNPEYKIIWNEFVESSKNGTFLFNRDYMDYHSDRFEDHSLLFFRKGKVYCLLPANVRDDVVYSHQGLTYGGLVMNDKCSAEGILQIFELMLQKLKEEGFKSFIYKPIPHIYHKIPSEEDLYALFRHNALLTTRNISSTVTLLRDPLKFKKDRNEAIRRAQRNNIIITVSEDFSSFWNILENNLSAKYSVRPVHSLREITSLATKFPENIKLFIAKKDDNILAGIICYIEKYTVHAQYISASPEGKALGAVDAIINYLVKEIYKDKIYFDLGTSNENSGRYLNESLIYQKEGFGGRAICYDTYQLFL